MRMFPRAGGKAPPVLASTLHLWGFDEGVAGVGAHDLMGTAPLTTLGGTPPSIDSPVGFNGRQLVRATPNFFRRTATDAADVTAMLSHTMIGCVRMDSPYANDGYLYLLGDGVTGFAHALVLAADRHFRIVFHNYLGIFTSVDFGQLLPTGRWIPFAVTRLHDPASVANDTYSLFLDGGLAQTITGVSRAAAASASARWHVGCDVGPGFGTNPNASVAALGAYTGVLPSAQIEDALAGMRQLSYETSIYRKSEVQDGGGTYRDLTSLRGVDFLKSASLQDDVDKKIATSTIRCLRDKQGMHLGRYNDNVLNKTPFAGDPRSAGYSVGGELLALTRSIRTYVDRRALDTEQLDDDGLPHWNIQFDGVIDDVDWGGDSNELSIAARDFGARLLDVFIPITTTRGSAGGTPLETELQQLITDAKGDAPAPAYLTQWGLPAVATYDLLTVNSPLWNIRQWAQQPMALLQALNVLAEQIGWTVRVSFDQGLNGFRVQLYEPGRRQTWPAVRLTGDEILKVNDLKVGLADIRNEVWVTFSPAPGSSLVIPTIPSGTGTATPGSVYFGPAGTYAAASTSQGEEPNRVTYRVRSDQLNPTEQGFDSITRNGVRRMIVGEASTSNINTLAEAQRLAVAMLRDLHEPMMSKGIRTFDMPEAELGDVILCRADGVRFTSDQQLAVVGLSSDGAKDGAFSMLNLRGRPSGGSAIHLEKENRAGLAPAPTGNPTATDSTAGMVTRDRRQLHQALTDLVGQYMRGGRALGGNRNQDFSTRTQGEAPPDSWSMFAGVWGTDTQLVKGVSESGLYALRLTTSVGRPYSDWIPVRNGYALVVEVRHKRELLVGTANTRVVVEWYDRDRVLVLTTGALDSIPEFTNWSDGSLVFDPPLGVPVAWARIIVQRTAGTGAADTILLDKCGGTSAASNFRGYRDGAAQALLPEGTQVQAIFNSAQGAAQRAAGTSWDDSNNLAGVKEHNAGSGIFTCRADGWYRFEANFTVNFAGISGANNTTAEIRRGGGGGQILAQVLEQSNVVAGTVRVSMNTGLVWLFRGDTVAVFVTSTITGLGTPQIPVGVDNWFSGWRLFFES